MKITPIHTYQKSSVNSVKKTLLLGLGLFVSQQINMPIFEHKYDTFVHSSETVEAKKEIDLENQFLNDTVAVPSPILDIAGKEVFASAVIDISQNQLFHYDSTGIIKAVYPVASGKRSTPTHTGIRKISEIQTYPYKDAPIESKRRQHPLDYGPKVIILKIIDSTTGEIIGDNGEYLHGTKDPKSIGKYASKGCIRMDNDTIKQLSEELKSGQYILIKK